VLPPTAGNRGWRIEKLSVNHPLSCSLEWGRRRGLLSIVMGTPAAEAEFNARKAEESYLDQIEELVRLRSSLDANKQLNEVLGNARRQELARLARVSYMIECSASEQDPEQTQPNKRTAEDSSSYQARLGTGPLSALATNRAHRPGTVVPASPLSLAGRTLAQDRKLTKREHLQQLKLRLAKLQRISSAAAPQTPSPRGSPKKAAQTVSKAPPATRSWTSTKVLGAARKTPVEAAPAQCAVNTAPKGQTPSPGLPSQIPLERSAAASPLRSSAPSPRRSLALSATASPGLSASPVLGRAAKRPVSPLQRAGSRNGERSAAAAHDANENRSAAGGAGAGETKRARVDPRRPLCRCPPQAYHVQAQAARALQWRS
jgi:cytoskeletal protein RodZ